MTFYIKKYMFPVRRSSDNTGGPLIFALVPPANQKLHYVLISTGRNGTKFSAEMVPRMSCESCSEAMRLDPDVINH